MKKIAVNRRGAVNIYLITLPARQLETDETNAFSAVKASEHDQGWKS
jgi:hypothetical protein